MSWLHLAGARPPTRGSSPSSPGVISCRRSGYPVRGGRQAGVSALGARLSPSSVHRVFTILNQLLDAASGRQPDRRQCGGESPFAPDQSSRDALSHALRAGSARRYDRRATPGVRDRRSISRTRTRRPTEWLWFSVSVQWGQFRRESPSRRYQASAKTGPPLCRGTRDPIPQARVQTLICLINSATRCCASSSRFKIPHRSHRRRFLHGPDSRCFRLIRSPEGQLSWSW